MTTYARTPEARARMRAAWVGRRQRMAADAASRFWPKVDKTGECWVWTGGLMGGYGRVERYGKTKKAHRIAYELTVGPIPDGMSVLHHCDNPPCVRPAHLFLGTQTDNMRDAAAKGRLPGPRPGRSPNARLTDDLVRTIRQRRATGETMRSLASAFGVGEATIKDVVRRRSWGHVT